jgi:hypothetical protein
MTAQTRGWSRRTVVLLMATNTIFMVASSLQRHHAHLTFGLDLGNVDQAIWNTLPGRPLGMTTLPAAAAGCLPSLPRLPWPAKRNCRHFVALAKTEPMCYNRR